MSSNSPYDADETTEDGFWYAYQSGPVDNADNRALRAAHQLQVPIVYFVANVKGWFRAIYPCFVTEDDHHARRVLLTVGLEQLGTALLPSDQFERRYTTREARVRLHQGRFRGAVLPAYRHRCAICSLREVALLDAAHIVGDSDPAGVAAVRNGVSLCTIHHRAFDQDLVGVDPDYRVQVAVRLLEDDDGPMLDLLKTFHGTKILLPSRTESRPDRTLLAVRFERFTKA